MMPNRAPLASMMTLEGTGRATSSASSTIPMPAANRSPRVVSMPGLGSVRSVRPSSRTIQKISSMATMTATMADTYRFITSEANAGWVPGYGRTGVPSRFRTWVHP